MLSEQQLRDYVFKPSPEETFAMARLALGSKTTRWKYLEFLTLIHPDIVDFIAQGDARDKEYLIAATLFEQISSRAYAMWVIRNWHPELAGSVISPLAAVDRVFRS